MQRAHARGDDAAGPVPVRNSIGPQATGCDQRLRSATFCLMPFIPKDERPAFGSDVLQSPKAVLETHMLGNPAGAGSRTELRRRFEEYAEDWKTKTAHLSVLSQRVMHPSYQKIIGLGQDALPLILERLTTHPDHWFWALRSIAGEDPVSREDVGKFAAMRDAWIRWGRNRGLI